MNEEGVKGLFAPLRYALTGEPIAEDLRVSLTPERAAALFELAATHDLAHLFAYGLQENGLLEGELVTKAEREILKAGYRYERLAYEYARITDALERACVPFLPLKGSVIRDRYPQPWMRTSCDIDVLVHEEDLVRATDVLIRECGCAYHEKGSHDVSLFTPARVHVELHYTLVEAGRVNRSNDVLCEVWQTATLREGKGYFYEMPDEMFYFYHVAHMAKHFEDGGCGVRPFLDLYLLEGTGSEEKRDALLSRGGLLLFARVGRALARVWLGGAAHDSVTEKMQTFVLRGGVYGNTENRIAVHREKKGGRVKYLLSKIFLSYDILKFQYPILQKHKILTPVMEVRRWGKLIFCGHLKRTVSEMRLNASITESEAEDTRRFLNEIGL